MPNYNLTSLQTDGYAIITDFLNQEEIDYLLKDYYEQEKLALVNDKTSKNSKHKIINSGKHLLEDKISAVLIQLAQQTDLKTDLIKSTGMYWNTTLTSLQYHCDHEPYYRWQNAYDSVNFWISIVKPSKTQSGLGIIPLSKLLKICPEITENHILRKGAKMFFTTDNQVDMRDDETGQVHTLNVDFSKLEIFPEVGPGDVVLMRGDCIHRTQDKNEHRISLSVRTTNSNGIIRKDQFVSGCLKKQKLIKHNFEEWNWTLSQFGDLDELVIGKIHPIERVVKFNN